MARAAEERAVDLAREKCLSLLATRARTRAELAEALRRQGVAEAVARQVLDRLTEVGLVDDRAVAEAYAERQAGRKGPRAIVAALSRRGVDAALAQEVAFAAGADDVRAAASALARQKLPTWRGLPPEVVRRRLTGLLGRRGYPPSAVYAVVRELLGDPGDLGGEAPAPTRWGEVDPPDGPCSA